MLWTVLLNLISVVFFAQVPWSAAINSDVVVVTRRPEASVLEITAEKSAILAASDHFFLFEKRADEIQPIASITKLMTALVFLDNNPGWDQIYTITAEDKVEGGRLNLFPGDRVTLKDLFYTSLVASDNGATLALTRATGLNEEEFIAKMNERTEKLGLTKTHFADPVGLSAANVSTARETAWLAQAAFARPEIRAATVSREYSFTTLDGRAKKIESTDYLLFDSALDSLQILAGKTGYTDQAGYCFVGWLRGSSGREVISVVLKADGKNERFRESKNLANWVFDSYDWNGK